MERVIGIDSSTRRTGMALFVDGQYSRHTLIDLSKSNEDTDARMNIMGRNILLVLNEWKPDTVFIEEPNGSGGNIDNFRKLSEIIGIVRGWCIENRVAYHECKPSVWRKNVGIEQGKKKRPELKDESIKFVFEKYGIEVGDDEADSICIAAGMIGG